MIRKHLPEAFQETFKGEFPDQFTDLIESIYDTVPVSIRLNPFKNTPSFPESQRIPWTRQAYYLLERPAFYADPFFHAGAYYVQEASSMIIEYVLDRLELKGDELCALDLCAAPGGKSTILSTFLESRGVLISNEIVWKRNLVLQENLERWGQSNTIITHNNSGDFRPLNSVFDFALIDAPCSGEGMFRKDPKVISEWSEQNVQACSARQSDILDDIRSSIKPGGYIVYSTCTYNKAENENLIDAFLENGEFESIEVKGLEKFGVLESKGKKSLFYRCFPHKVKGEGFSFCLLKRKNSVIPGRKSPKPRFKQNIVKTEFSDLEQFVASGTEAEYIRRENEIFALNGKVWDELSDWIYHLKVIRPGIPVAQLIHGDTIPTHSLALSTLLNIQLPHIDLTSGEALRVLQKDGSFLENTDFEQKWVRLVYSDNTLALAKALPNRLNIQLPKHFRIRKNIEDFL